MARRYRRFRQYKRYRRFRRSRFYGAKRKLRSTKRKLRKVRKALRYAAMPFKALRYFGKAALAARRAWRGPIV